MLSESRRLEPELRSWHGQFTYDRVSFNDFNATWRRIFPARPSRLSLVILPGTGTTGFKLAFDNPEGWQQGFYTNRPIEILKAEDLPSLLSREVWYMPSGTVQVDFVDIYALP